MESTTWGARRTSSYSTGANNCVEAAHAHRVDAVGIWDTKRREGGPLVITGHHWAAFLAEVKVGRFDG